MLNFKDLEKAPSGGTSDTFRRSNSKKDPEDFTTFEGFQKIGE